MALPLSADKHPDWTQGILLDALGPVLHPRVYQSRNGSIKSTPFLPAIPDLRRMGMEVGERLLGEKVLGQQSTYTHSSCLFSWSTYPHIFLAVGL